MSVYIYNYSIIFILFDFIDNVNSRLVNESTLLKTHFNKGNQSICSTYKLKSIHEALISRLWTILQGISFHWMRYHWKITSSKTHPIVCILIKMFWRSIWKLCKILGTTQKDSTFLIEKLKYIFNETIQLAYYLFKNVLHPT